MTYSSQATVIVFLSNSFIQVYAFNKTVILYKVIFKITDSDYLRKYKKFLKKFPGCKISFLIDPELTSFNIEKLYIFKQLPDKILSEQYISQNKLQHNYVGIVHFDSPAEAGKNSKILVSQLLDSSTLDSVLPISLHSQNILKSVYFLSLEFSHIIKNLLDDHLPRLDQNDLIFVTAFSNLTIKFVVFLQGKNCSISSANYEEDHSLNYIQGIIEQEISDILIKLKSENWTKIQQVYLVDNDLTILLKNDLSIQSFIRISNNKCAEDIVIESFIKNHRHEVFNSNLTQLRKKISLKEILKAVLVINILVLLYFLSSSFFHKIEKDRIIVEITNEQTILQNLLIQNINPKVTSFDNLKSRNLDLTQSYVTDQMSLKLIKDVTQILPKHLKIQDVNWERVTLDNINQIQNNEPFKIVFNLKFSQKNTLGSEKLEDIKQTITKLMEKFSNWHITHFCSFGEIQKFNHKTVYPIKLIIKGPIINTNL